MEAEKLKAAGEFSRLRRRFSRLTQDEPSARFLLNHLQVVRRLTVGPAAPLARRDPELTRKYIRPYIAESLRHIERRRILLFHTDFLVRRLNARFFAEAAHPVRPIWSVEQDGRTHEIWLKAHDLRGGEGDLALVFAADGQPLYELSFSLAPKASGSELAAMLIVRIQGARGRFAEIRRATTGFGDISPAHVLVSAAEGIAEALGVTTILGIRNNEQLSKTCAEKEGCLFDYDAFWESLGGRPRHGWFQFEAPFAPKPLSQTAASHRRRTRRKRRAKALVREQVTSVLRSRYAGAAA